MEFLRKTAGFLYEKYTENFSSLCIVLPNRRAGVFLKKYLSEQIKKPVFLPRIISIQDFIIELSGVNIADEFTSLIELYKSYTEIKGSDAESFDDFLHWGAKLLQDFDELDQHLADTEFVFTYLNEDKNLALWALDKKPLSEFQQNYLAFYGMLHKIYLGYTAQMLARGMATYGMACRKVSNMLKENELSVEYSKVVFTGLNALSASEEFIINSFYEKGEAEILWDGDEYYINDANQEAGNFIRKYLTRWPGNENKWIGDELLSGEKNIYIVAVAGKIGQVKYTAEEIVKLLNANVNSEQISVVLNEESLLIPMLNSVPDGIEKFNITMGYPMKLSPVYNFIETVFELHANADRFRNVKNAKEPLFYYKDLQKIYNHYFFNLAVNGASELVSYFAGLDKIFYTRAEVLYMISKSLGNIHDAVKSLFDPWNQKSDKAIECINDFISHIKDSVYSSRGLDSEFLFSAYKILSQVMTACKEAGITLSSGALHQLVRQHVSQTTVPFIGEPLNGLQIMGMLETRTLDFDTVFMLSVNEGVLPKGKSGTSFIPHGIRVDSGLPTYKQNEEIFAYHFYRILQRSKNVYLVYNTQADDMGGGERSRFINQVVYELPKKNPNIRISEEYVTFPPEKKILETITIKKDEDILKKLDEMALKGLSPSSLNIFRKCSLQFYFSRIAGIRETDELSETIDSREFGDHIHKVLEELFSTCEGKSLSEAIINDFKKNYEEILKRNFEKDQPKSYERMSGKNLLIYNVIKDYLRIFFETQFEIISESQSSNIDYKVLYTEKELQYSFDLPSGDRMQKVLIKGVADRIDLIGNCLQIIDYKSGDVQNKNFDIDKLLNDEQDYKNDYCFQVLLYLWLYNNENSEIKYETQQCGVWSFRKIAAGVKNVFYLQDPANKKSKIFSMGAGHLSIFQGMLNELLTALFDPAQDFVQTQNTDNCELCPYKLMCGR